MIDFKGHRIEKDIILTCVRWYLAHPLSYRNLEEIRTPFQARAVPHFVADGVVLRSRPGPASTLRGVSKLRTDDWTTACHGACDKTLFEVSAIGTHHRNRILISCIGFECCLLIFFIESVVRRQIEFDLAAQ
ncbi:MAG TPA: hypothetical protein VLU73_13715 [Methylococcaceae bacterium]|nr:hypothetical protein [Methylococcaceae bacterium]